VIRSFGDTATKVLWETGKNRHLASELTRTARRKLLLIHAARALADLRVPPGNRLERLKADREGQYSIRINDRYRICFAWKQDGAYEVEIVDYH
jgi:proteic killer suppression protein